MKRVLMTVVLLGLAAGAARADWGGARGAAPVAPQGGAMPQAGGVPQPGGPNTLLGMGNPYNGVAPDPYGLHPRIKRLFHLGSYGQRGYGQQGPAYNPNGYPPGAYGPAQGTLVFPNHPFVRSPRDFFMLDLNK
ncbi:MAG TPA: hypothetical protein VGE74_14980 [Gemmata sp.]